jgi:hypothetical protein
MGDLSMWVTIDGARVLERFTSEALLDEVAARKGVTLPDKQRERDDVLLDVISEAVAYLKSGRADDALLTLERGAFPKFKSLDQATALYLRRAR